VSPGRRRPRRWPDPAVAPEHAAEQGEVQTADRGRRAAQHQAAAGGVVGDGVGQPDPPVGDAAVDDLDGRQRVRRGRQQVGDADQGAGQRAAEHQRDLRLGPRLQEPAHRDRCVRGVHHVGEQVAVVRLVDTELRPHRGRCEADLEADDAGTGAGPQLGLAQLDAVRVLDRQLWMALGQRRHRAAGVRRQQQVGDLVDVDVGHAELPSGFAVRAPRPPPRLPCLSRTSWPR
jgi:hypothetical protein